MLIGADGPNSIVRRAFVPDIVAMPWYLGYVAGMEVVPERGVNVTYFMLPGEHVIVCVNRSEVCLNFLMLGQLSHHRNQWLFRRRRTLSELLLVLKSVF